MAIDASIPLQAKTFSLADLLNDQQGRDIKQAQLDEFKRKQQQQTTLGELLPKAYAGDQQALNGVAGADPETYQRIQTYRQTSAKTASELHQQQMEQTGRLLRAVKADPSKWDMARNAAIQMGIPADSIPQAYDPRYVDEHLMMADAWDKDGGQSLTSNMKELVALGYRPGTPEFQSALAQSINAGYAKPYTGSGGETRLYTPNIAVPQQQSQAALQHGQPSSRIIAQRPAGKTNDQLMAEAYEAVKSGQASYDEVFQQLQAWGVNP